MKTILTRNGHTVFIDDEYYPELSQYKWYSHKKGDSYYAHCYIGDICGKRHLFFMHRMILGLIGKDIHVDHINRNGLDNQLSNLRLCDRYQNMQNCKIFKNNKSGIKGIYWNKKEKKWRAKIMAYRKVYHIGSYKTAEEARDAYINKAKELHGTFARLG